MLNLKGVKRFAYLHTQATRECPYVHPSIHLSHSHSFPRYHSLSASVSSFFGDVFLNVSFLCESVCFWGLRVTSRVPAALVFDISTSPRAPHRRGSYTTPVILAIGRASPSVSAPYRDCHICNLTQAHVTCGDVSSCLPNKPVDNLQKRLTEPTPAVVKQEKYTASKRREVQV